MISGTNEQNGSICDDLFNGCDKWSFQVQVEIRFHKKTNNIFLICFLCTYSIPN